MDFIIPIPKITDSNSRVDYFNMFILFEELNKTEKNQIEKMIKSQIKDLIDKDLEKRSP